MEFIVFVFNVAISIVFLILKLILAPIDYLIQQFIPGLSDALTAVGDFLTLVATGLGWAVSAAGIPVASLALIATYWIFKLTLPWNIFLIKLAVKWFKALKP